MRTLSLAARQPFALAVLLAAIFTGLTVVFWMLPVGIVVYGIVVFLELRNPALQASAKRSNRPPARSQLTSLTFQTMMTAIERTQQEIEHSVAQTEAPLNNLLQSISTQTSELAQQAHELARKGEVIEAYLAAVNYRKLQDQINRIDGQIAQTSDSYTVQQLQETRQALVDRQTNAQALETYIGRINAQLQNIQANLENVFAETVRLRTADAVSVNSVSNDVALRLSDLNSDMDAFQRVLDTALAQSGAS